MVMLINRNVKPYYYPGRRQTNSLRIRFYLTFIDTILGLEMLVICNINAGTTIL